PLTAACPVVTGSPEGRVTRVPNFCSSPYKRDSCNSSFRLLFSCVSCVSWLKNSHVTFQNRHHRRQRFVSHRRLHESKMGEGQNPVRFAVRRIAHRQTRRTRRCFSPAPR